MRRLAIALLISVATLMAIPAIASAGTVYVSALTGSDVFGNGGVGTEFATIQRGIDAANVGDTVAIAAGTYNENITMSDRVSLQGAGPDLTVVTPSAPTCAIFAFGIGSNTKISGLTVRGATGGTNIGWYSNVGGGLAMRYSSLQVENCSFTGNNGASQGSAMAIGDSSNPTITNCTFDGNSAGWGGAVVVMDAGATFVNDTFTNNRAGSHAGALRVMGNVNVPVTVRGCTFDSNTAGWRGGAIEFAGVDATLVDCTIARNTATAYQGGGILASSGMGTITISRSVIASNVAGDSGGGVAVAGRTVTINDSEVRGNSAVHGGGLDAATGSTLMVNDSEVALNTAANEGGAGIDAYNATVGVYRGSVRANSTSGSGGAIKAWASGITIHDCSLKGNTSGYQGSVALMQSATMFDMRNCVVVQNQSGLGGGTLYLDATPSSIVNSTIADNTNSGVYDGGVVLSYGSGLIVNSIVWGNAKFDVYGDASVSYSDVQNYSTSGTKLPTRGAGTISVDPAFVSTATADYRLQPASPCVDTGSTDLGETSDIAGIVRPQGAATDMGAYEWIDPATTSGPTDPSLSSSTHGVDSLTNKRAGTIQLTGATAGTARIAGYSYSLTQDSAGSAPHTKMLGASATSFDFTAPSDGTWYVNVATVDALGNWSTGVSYGPLRIDATAPTITTIAPTGWVRDRAAVAATYSDESPLYSYGMYTVKGSFEVDWGSMSPYSYHVFATGEGENTVCFNATDRAGNYAERNVTVWVDSTAPTTNDDYDGSWRRTPFDVTLTADDSGSGVAATYYQIGDADPVEYTGSPFTIGTPGETTVKYWSVDNVGIAEEPNTIVVKIDFDGPTVSTNAPTDWVNHDVDVVFEAADAQSGFANFILSTSGATGDHHDMSPSNPATITVSAEGESALEAVAIDQVGNFSPPERVSVRIDKEAPMTYCSYDGSPSSTPVAVTLDAEDALSGVAHIYYALNGSEPTTYTGTFTLSAEGRNELTYWSVDNAGNSGDIQTTPTLIDTQAPTVRNDAPSGWANHDVAVTFTGEDASTRVASLEWWSPELFMGGTTANPGTLVASAEGTTTFEVAAVDTLYHRSETSTAQVRIDRHAPESSATVSAEPGSTTIDISATDALSGVAESRWYIDEGAEQIGDTVYCDTVGAHTLTYWSVDNAGNAESPKTVDFVVAPGAPDAPSSVHYTLRGAKTYVTWNAAARATGYAVRVNGRVVATVAGSANSALLPMVLGPKSVVTVSSSGVQALSSMPVRGGYVSCSWWRAETVRFSAGSTKLTDAAKAELRQLAYVIAKQGFHRVSIAGYTSARYPNSAAERKALSLERAVAAKRYLSAQLKKRGTWATITTVGRGATDPVAPNTTARNAAKNRRAEISVR